MKVNTISIRKLRMKELQAFCKHVSVLIQMTYGSGVYPFIDAYQTACAAFDDALSDIDETQSLTDADALNDQMWSALNHIIKGHCLHLDPKVREAAETIRRVFDQTPNPTTLPYEQEYGELQALLGRLDKIPAETHALAHTADWVEMLRQSLAEYEDALQHQIDIDGKRQIGINARTRLDLIAAWDTMNAKINALLELELDEKLPGVAESLNAFIDKTNIRLKMRTNRKDSSDDDDIDFSRLDDIVPS